MIELIGVAEARTSARDWPAAIRLWERIVSANPVNGIFWSRLGSARFNAGQYRAAIPALEHAVDLGQGIPANHSWLIASAHARLGETEQALQWLERALALGHRDVARLRSDETFAALRAEPRFQRLVPIPASLSGLSRVAGWEVDMDYLLWQMDRIAVDPYGRRPHSWFEAELRRIAGSAGDRSDSALTMDLMRVLREVGDGHSGVMPGRSEDWALSLPLQIQAFDDGVYIVSADPKHRDLVGARLLRFGGRPIEEVMAASAATVSRDNEGGWVRLQASFRLRYTALLAAAGIGQRDGASLRVKTIGGLERDVRVAADTSEPDTWNQKPNPPSWVNMQQILPGSAPLAWRHADQPYWFEHLIDEKTVYFGFNSVRDGEDEPLAAFAERLRAFIGAHGVERLVVDLRWNNGGNSNLLAPLLSSLIRSENVNRRGRLFVLIGPRTFSAAQNAASLLERFTQATFVGEPTGSSPNFIGEEEPFELPYSKVNVNLSTERWQSGWPHDRRRWIAPLIYAPVTFADLTAKRDPALDAILSLPIPD